MMNEGMIFRAMVACLIAAIFSSQAVAEVPNEPILQPNAVPCEKIPLEPQEDATRDAVDYTVGLIFLEYDLDGDGRPDLMTARQIETLSERSAEWSVEGSVVPPLFYWVDLNADSHYDQMWIDQGGLDRCSDLTLYEGSELARTLLPVTLDHPL